MSTMLNMLLVLFLADGSREDRPKLKVEEAPSLQGEWAAAGEQNGKPYKAKVSLVKFPKSHDRYVVEWEMDNGLLILGSGMVDGGKLVVGWSYVTQLEHRRGVSVYEVGKNELSGRWSMVPGGLGTETLTRVIKEQP